MADLGEYNQCQTSYERLYSWIWRPTRRSSGLSYLILYSYAESHGVWTIYCRINFSRQRNSSVKHALELGRLLLLAITPLVSSLPWRAQHGAYLMDMVVSRERLLALDKICKALVLHASFFLSATNCLIVTKIFCKHPFSTKNWIWVPSRTANSLWITVPRMSRRQEDSLVSTAATRFDFPWGKRKAFSKGWHQGPNMSVVSAEPDLTPSISRLYGSQRLIPLSLNLNIFFLSSMLSIWNMWQKSQNAQFAAYRSTAGPYPKWRVVLSVSKTFSSTAVVWWGRGQIKDCATGPAFVAVLFSR